MSIRESLRQDIRKLRALADRARQRGQIGQAEVYDRYIASVQEELAPEGKHKPFVMTIYNAAGELVYKAKVDPETNVVMERIWEELQPQFIAETIKGIGPVYAQRLVQSGIESVFHLADASPERLRDIVGKAGLDYNDWIRQAQDLVSQERHS